VEKGDFGSNGAKLVKPAQVFFDSEFEHNNNYLGMKAEPSLATLMDVPKNQVAALNSKGQVTIPAAIRAKLGWAPKTKLLVYTYGAVILKKREAPDLSKELETMHKRIKAKIAEYGELTNEEINQVIHAHRRKKRTSNDP
jgi:AbrB family looped-hinge helix DNA binding protein